MSSSGHFNLLARCLHWTMSAMIFAMLFIGAAMVASLGARAWLIDLHRPLGIAILLLALLRLFNRLRHRPPALPADLPRWQASAARASHWLLYGLIFAVPLVGWLMLSASGQPVTMFASWQLPPIAPVDSMLYARLRTTHALVAWLLFATVLVHLAAALYHVWVRRDGVLAAMVGSGSQKGAGDR